MEITVPATKGAGDRYVHITVAATPAQHFAHSHRLNVFIPGRTAPVRVTIPMGVSAGQTFQVCVSVLGYRE